MKEYKFQMRKQRLLFWLSSTTLCTVDVKTYCLMLLFFSPSKAAEIYRKTKRFKRPIVLSISSDRPTDTEIKKGAENGGGGGE